MNLSKLPFYLLSIIAIVITFFIAYEKGLRGLALFASFPYALTLYLVGLAQKNTALITAKIVTIFIVSVGLYFLLDTTYMERRLEYKFSFLFIPIWQYIMLLVTGLVIYLSNKKASDISQ